MGIFILHPHHVITSAKKKLTERRLLLRIGARAFFPRFHEDRLTSTKGRGNLKDAQQDDRDLYSCEHKKLGQNKESIGQLKS